MMNKKINIIILIVGLTFASTNKLFSQICERDSANFHSAIFRDPNNFCNGTAYASFKYLESHCLKVGLKEKKCLKLLGDFAFGKHLVSRRTDKMDFRTEPWIDEPYDYYIMYLIDTYCTDSGALAGMPCTCACLFFKDKTLVKIEYRTFG
jgi:hypothetical protein